MSGDSRVHSRGDVEWWPPIGALEEVWQYETLAPVERDVLLARILLDIVSGQLSMAGSIDRWNKGWKEQHDAFLASQDVESLVPKYVRPLQPMRIEQELVRTCNPYFERDWWRLFLDWLATKYLFTLPGPLLEFGCGSGWNVAHLAAKPGAPMIYGLDWSPWSVTIMKDLRRLYGYNVEGVKYDFFNPAGAEMHLGKTATVLTVGALEQTGDRFRPFIDELVRQKPGLCVHVEPIIEWYDQTNLVDLTAVMFLRKRGYWWGFPAYMSKLEREGKVEIVETRRTYVGSKYMEGYMLFVWRPL